MLNGFKEAVNPVSTTGTGTFHATISKDETQIDYELTFANLEGNVLQAHIHIGHTQTAGGIVLWLCGSDTNPGPAGTPRCNENDPSDNRNGKVSGTLTVADVLRGSEQRHRRRRVGGSPRADSRRPDVCERPQR